MEEGTAFQAEGSKGGGPEAVPGTWGGADCQDGEEECAAGQTGKALRSQSSGTVSIWGLRPAPHLPHCIKMCFLRGFLLMKQEVRSLELAAS